MKKDLNYSLINKIKLIAIVISTYLIFDYATLYRLKHSSITTAKDFKLTDAEYNEFVTWVKTKTYDYTTKSEKQFETYNGIMVRVRYYVQVTISRQYAKVTKQEEFIV